MNLNDFFIVISRRMWVIIVTFIVTIGVVATGTYLATPIYTAIAKVRISSASGASGSYSDYAYTDRLLNTYVQIATSSPVIDELIKRVNLAERPKIKVEVIPNTELIGISVENTNPNKASEIANALSDILVQQSEVFYTGSGKSLQQILSEQLTQIGNDLSQMRQDYQTLLTQNPADKEKLAAASQAIDLKQKTYSTLLDQYEQARVRDEIRANVVSIVEPAIPPRVPSKPKPIFNLALGALIGLAAGMGLAFFLENMDNTIYTPEQIEAMTGSHLLGKIPSAKKQSREPRFQEAFRRLRTNILMLYDGKPPKTILITSARPEEGKSMLVTNLGLSLVQAGKKVVMVDGDMRMPSLHKTFDLSNDIGLSNFLLGEVDLQKAIQNAGTPNLFVITSGSIPSNPVELLGLAEMPKVIKELEKSFDLVLIDTPALLAVTDAILLAKCAEGVILVVERAKSQTEDVQNVIKQLNDIYIKPIGAVINRAEPDSDYYYYRHRRKN